jgi:HAD superfamily hydrolase (TIGR01459 family)
VTQALDGIGAVAARYDVFLFDMWGCLHDGIRAFPGVADLLARLRGRGARSIVISNAPRLVASLRLQMPSFGLDPGAFDGIVTSGEDSWQALVADAHKLGRRFVHVGSALNLGDPAEIGFEIVADVEAADFILATGPAGDGTLDMTSFGGMLAKARARDLALVCANPDLEVLRGEKRFLCAGTLAQAYEAIGGRTIYHGKPHAGVYRRALDLAGPVAPSRVLAVGDAMRTDVAGARAFGFDQVFISGGIHAEGLQAPIGTLPSPGAMADLAQTFGFAPTYVMAELRW